MPQSSADRLLSRITALHKSLQLDEGGQLSSMERDLMLGYLRELYEIYAETTPASPPTFARSTPSPSPVVPPPPPPAPPVTPPPPPVAPPPAPVVPPPPPPPAPEPAPPVAPPAPEPPPFVATPPPVPAYTAPPPAPEPEYTSASREINALFLDEGSASPFGRQALPDLTRGLTINNRVLFARDLFNQDTDLLNTTLRTLNSSGSFAAARPVLESLARRFDWVDEAKRETAGEFIELVRRRYA